MSDEIFFSDKSLHGFKRTAIDKSGLISQRFFCDQDRAQTSGENLVLL